MKIAVSSDGENLDAQLDPRFGRCRFFLVVNPDDLSFEAIVNEGAAGGGGAGVQAARLIASHGVDAVFTGNCGPNAAQILAAAGIQLFGRQAGTVRQIVAKFSNGDLKSADETTVDTHYGLNDSTAPGRGGVMGGGRGFGSGQRGRRTRNQGMGMCAVPGPSRIAAGPQTKDQELESLKRQADSLNKRMKHVISRIDTLENQ